MMGLSMYCSTSTMRLTVSAESVMRMLLVRSIACICAPARTNPVMTACASAMSMYLSSTICETNCPCSSLGVASPVSESGKIVLSACLRNSELGTTFRNLSPTGSSAIPLRLRICSIAMRYCLSSRGLSGVVRSVMFTAGTPGDLMTVRPVRNAYSIITRSTDASWKFSALGEASYGITGEEPELPGCVTAERG